MEVTDVAQMDESEQTTALPSDLDVSLDAPGHDESVRALLPSVVQCPCVIFVVRRRKR